MKKIIGIILISFLHAFSWAGTGNLGGFDSYTKILLHLNGADGSTTFTDENSHSFSRTSGAEVDTGQSVFGGASLLLDGTDDNIYTAASTDWNFGTGNFTLDCRVRFSAWPDAANDANACAFISQFYYNTNVSFVFGFWNDVTPNQLKFAYTTDGTFGTIGALSVNWSPSLNIWYHVQCVRSGANLYFFVDGVQQGTTQNIGAGTNIFYSTTKPLYIGGRIVDAANTAGKWWNMHGWLEEVRISKGIARNTSNFTIPTREYNNYKDVGFRIRKGSTTYILPVQDLVSQKLRIRDGATTYGIPLLATSDYYATGLRINDGASVKSIPLEAE